MKGSITPLSSVPKWHPQLTHGQSGVGTFSQFSFTGAPHGFPNHCILESYRGVLLAILDSIKTLKSVVHWAEFGERVSGKLGSIRFIHETDDQTLDRVLKQAIKTICNHCRGSGRPMVVDGPCSECHGTGEKAYDPNLKPVEEIMES